MRTFVLRARKASIHPDQVFSQVGKDAHFEIIAHSLINAFYISNQMRMDVSVYVVLESTPDFPRTLKFSSSEGLSFPGFHEHAILTVVADALRQGQAIKKDETRAVAPGIEISGYGFDVLMQHLIKANHSLYLLDKKGDDIRKVTLNPNPVFIFSDHLAMPKNSIKVLERNGLTKINLGRKMLFASQCVVLAQHELDRQDIL